MSKKKVVLFAVFMMVVTYISIDDRPNNPIYLETVEFEKDSQND